MSATETSAALSGFQLFLEENLQRDMLRFTTAGSVDDGKSTLIGRLLHDTKSVFEDQLASVRASRINRSTGPIDFSLLTDGLRAEREQGITIDVAYRYFATSRRKFIIADTPGHEQYTRNMATGASTADLAIVLLDATKGVLPQTRRHAHIASLLGIPHLLMAVNKMDAVEFREEVFDRLRTDALALAANLNFQTVQCIPVSALEGDNIVTRSARTPWYAGPAILQHLETVPLVATKVDEALRLPVQYVIRPDASFRGFAGQIATGRLRPGDAVTALPSGQTSRIKAIESFDGPLPEAFSPMSVNVTLEDEIDLSRGDMLASPEALPQVSRNFAATIVWMHAEPLVPGARILLKHTSRVVRARIRAIRHRLNVENSEQLPASSLQMNDIASVEVETTHPLFFDLYGKNRVTGSFILIDPLSNTTLAAGMIQQALQARTSDENERQVTQEERTLRNGHRSALVLLPGQSDLAAAVERILFDQGLHAYAIGDGELSGAPLAATLQAISALGTIVIYSGSLSLAGQKEALSATFSGRLLEPDSGLLDGLREVTAQHLVDAAKKLAAVDPAADSTQRAI